MTAGMGKGGKAPLKSRVSGGAKRARPHGAVAAFPSFTPCKRAPAPAPSRGTYRAGSAPISPHPSDPPPSASSPGTQSTPTHAPPPPPPDLRSDSHPMSAPAAQANPLAQLASGACGCARDRPKRRTGDGGANVRCKRRVRRVHGAVRAVTRKPTDLNARPPSLSTDPLS